MPAALRSTAVRAALGIGTAGALALGLTTGVGGSSQRVPLRLAPNAHHAAVHHVVEKVVVKGYGDALATGSGRSLYLLSVEAHDHVHCKGSCLSIWPPLLVPASLRRVPLALGVKGKLGFVYRSKTTKQVTFNGYPVYTFSGDSGPRQAHGEGISSFGGTWYLVAASATTPAGSRILPRKPAPKTTSGGGSGYGSGYGASYGTSSGSSSGSGSSGW